MEQSRKTFDNFFKNIIIKIVKWLRIDMNRTIFEIIQSESYYINFFLCRICFRQDEYEKHRIPLTYQRFKYAILITFNGWLVITLLIFYIWWKESKIVINYVHFEKILNIQRVDLVFICMICIFCVAECIFIGLLSKVLEYKSGIHDFFQKISSNFIPLTPSSWTNKQTTYKDCGKK